MEVKTLKPYGFCAGVDKAIKIALEAAKENKSKKVYLLGMLVHNEDVISMLEEAGLTILNEKDGTLEELLLKVEDNSTVVFSAHGHTSSLEALAKQKHLTIYDATCEFVKENLLFGQKNEDVIYIGVKGHLESEAFILENPNSTFFDLKTMSFSTIKVKGDSPKVISQTTISFLELTEAHKKILSMFPKAKIISERCSSTSLRQNEILKLENVDLLLILGSKTSNNSTKLAELGNFKGIKTELVLNLDEVKRMSFKGIKKVALASGASTSRETFEEVATYLKSLD